MVRVAVVQFDPQFAAGESNVAAVEARLESLATQRVELAVFPEYALTGYVYRNLSEARDQAEAIPGPLTTCLAQTAAHLGIWAVVGLLERDGDLLFNSAVVVGPRGLEGQYRKSHLLCLGVDRYATEGPGPLEVLNLPIGRLGILICYDLRFPESARTLALKGAQIIALPTNWPTTSGIQPDVFTRARAAENRVWVLAADRVGEERGARFLGRSQIVDPDGTVRAEAPTEGSAILIEEIDLSVADQKRVVLRPGEHEMDVLGDRRPDLYGILAAERAPAP